MELACKHLYIFLLWAILAMLVLLNYKNNFFRYVGKEIALLGFFRVGLVSWQKPKYSIRGRKYLVI
ncbi:MAG: hypothetical protein PWR04_1711 [Anaerophaga sp.]|nr:hypothetical protein [Anaerophaga sp.]